MNNNVLITKDRVSRIRAKHSAMLAVCVFNVAVFLILSGVVIIHNIRERAFEPLLYAKYVKPPPPVKPPALKGGKGATSNLDPSINVIPPVTIEAASIITTSISSFSLKSSPIAISLPNLSLNMPQGTTLVQTPSATTNPFDSAGSNPFGNINLDEGPALTGYLYDLKRNADGSPTDIKDDGFFKDRSLEDTYEAKWHWGRYVESFSKDPKKKDQLTDSVLNEAKLINGLISGTLSDTRLESYYRSKPLYAYQWSIAQQSPEDIVKAFGVSNEVKPTHLLIVYKGSVVAPNDGMFRFICYNRGGAIAVRLGNNLVAGCAPWNDPLISNQPFKFGGEGSSILPYIERAGKWFPVSQGEKYPIEIILTTGTLATSIHLMIEEQQPKQPYLPTTLQWDTLKKRDNPRITLRFPLFALRTGIPQAPFIPPSLTPPGADAPADISAEFEKDGPHYENPEVSPDPIVFPGSQD